MKNNLSQALSPLDGRYSNVITQLQNYFSEFAFMKYRTKVEIEYFIWLSKHKFFKLNKKTEETLRTIWKNFSEKDFSDIKTLEKAINHDVKAVELFLKKKLDNFNQEKYKEMVHFGLTSQDINNTSISLIWHDFLKEQYYPTITSLLSTIQKNAKKYKSIPMLSRTHGQPASTTTVGKELMVFYERIQNQLSLLKSIPHTTKFGGAVGNMNAHYFVFPKTNWISLHDKFIKTLKLERQKFTTQIEHYDNLTAKFDTIKRINIILIDFARDIWSYISEEYFKQKISNNEVGSSAMPHKINPIDFENAEGNFGIANTLYEHFANKLPISRLQRDLSDSTVIRNTGVAAGHTILGLQMLIKGVMKLEINKPKILEDLKKHPEIIAEGIQMLLRTSSIKNPYELLKQFTRQNHSFSLADIHRFIDSLKISHPDKEKLKQLKPENYLGKFPDF